METVDYLIAWCIYLTAATLLSWLAWRAFRKYLWRGLAYFLICMTVALFYTPWYVLPERQILAPAVIVFVMDSITVAPLEGIRALIPLVMAMFLGIIVSLVLTVVYRVRRRRAVKRSP